jgi:hypothetical protein
MLNTARWTSRLRLIVAFLATSSILLHAETPQGWLLAGNKPSEYETGVEPKPYYNDHPSAYLKSKKAADAAIQRPATEPSTKNTTTSGFDTPRFFHSPIDECPSLNTALLLR